jgi:hypothetical protein
MIVRTQHYYYFLFTNRYESANNQQYTIVKYYEQ